MLSAFEKLGRLYRDPADGLIAGVCAGIADYVGLRPVQVRLLVILGLVFFFVPTVIGYVALAFLLQPRPADLYRAEDEAQFWRQARTAPQGAVSELRDRFRSLEARLDRIEGFVVSEEYELRRKFRDIES